MDKRLIFGQIGETSQIIVHKNKKYSKYLKISSIDCIFATGNGFCDIKHIHDMKQIEVVAAIIHDDLGRIFATQRGYGDMKDAFLSPEDVATTVTEAPSQGGGNSGGGNDSL